MTEALLSSGGLVAAVSLAAAVLTLGFTVWISAEVRHQNRISQPLAQAASMLDASIESSQSSLWGWVANGDPEFVVARTHAWEERIDPALAQIFELADESDLSETLTQASELNQSLRELAQIQWAIEDVARTPGNSPAVSAYTERLEPISRSILVVTGDVVQQYRREGRGGDSLEFMALLTSFRSTFVSADLALNQVLFDRTDARETEFDQLLSASGNLMAQITSSAESEMQGDLLDLMRFAAREFRAYESLVPEIQRVKKEISSTVSEELFTRDAGPAAERALSLSSELAKSQILRAKREAESLAEVSYGVIAVALLMGLLSGGSLLLSFRLRQQVGDVLSKARKLGQYVLARRLGGGAMGEVFLAHHAMLRRPTAIKLLRADGAMDLRSQQRFQSEVQSTSQLTHPNTIEVFDYGRTPEGVFYYAMELIDGFTLETLVSSAGPVDPGRVVHILSQICGSLSEAHGRGLVHRDIKPENIMLTERGGVFDVVKVLDFGLVNDLSSEVGARGGESEVRNIVGTPMYLAPEAIYSSSGGTASADLYALGAVAYYLLAGEPVFPPGPTAELLDRHLHEDPDFPSKRLGRVLPSELEYVVMSCLEKDPAERPASAAHLASMLADCAVAEWTISSAELWWNEYGEALSNKLDLDESVTADRSGVEVDVGASRI